MSKTQEKTGQSLELKGRYYRWYPAERHQGHAEEMLSISVSCTAFVLVDVYLPEKETLLAKAEEDKPLSEIDYRVKYSIAADQIAPALEMARAIDLPIIYVMNSAPRIAIENSEFAKKLVLAQGFSIEKEFAEANVDPLEYHRGPADTLSFIAPLRPLPGDLYIRKHVYSGFYDSRLETTLRNMNISNLIFVGFRLDCCLGTTMLDALYRNFKVILLRDCTLACELPDEIEDKKFTQRMLIWFETMVGVTVDSKAFISACEELLSRRKLVGA